MSARSPSSAAERGDGLVRLGLLALVVSLFAAVLAYSIWLSAFGAVVGLAGVVIGVAAVRDARRRRKRPWAGATAIVLSTLAILAFPSWYVLCSDTLSCV